MSAYKDENMNYSNDVTQSGKSNSIIEREGLIPVTGTILNEAKVTKEETVEYQGIPINDITVIGYIFEYIELEGKVKIRIFDYTGFIEIVFYNKKGFQDGSGINKLNYDGTRKAVQIFGTVKAFKNEKFIIGAKVIPVSSSFVLYHRADVIHSWLYLTGKLKELKDNHLARTAEEAKMLAMESINVNNQSYTPVKDDNKI